jgi:hypothetical protein
MQNFTLLRELGYSKVPVMLKRGISATIEEWLLSAEYILAGGNNDLLRSNLNGGRLGHSRSLRRFGRGGLPCGGLAGRLCWHSCF